jgi:hypothetical protein
MTKHVRRRRWMVRRTSRMRARGIDARRVGIRLGLVGKQAVAAQQFQQGDAAEPGGRVTQEVTPMEQVASRGRQVVFVRHGHGTTVRRLREVRWSVQGIVRNSLLFRMARQTETSPCCSRNCWAACHSSASGGRPYAS